MRISHNLTALNTYRQLNQNQNQLSKSTEKLSSGLRINRAGDDAAGLAISEKMRSQIRGLNQVSRNAQDGISMVQTAEGALNETHSLLQRGRELSVQAANDSNNAQDRQNIQDEINQITKEIDRISNTTQFNNINLLNVTNPGSISSQQGAIDGLQKGWLQAAVDLVQNTYGIGGNGQTINVVLDSMIDGPGGTLAYVSDSYIAGVPGPGSNLQLHVDMSDFNNAAYPDGGSPIAFDRVLAHEMTHAAMDANINVATGMQTWFMEGTAEATIGADERLSADLTAVGGAQNLANLMGSGTTWVQDSAHYSMGYAAIRYMDYLIKNNGGTGVKDILSHMASNPTETLDAALGANAALVSAGAGSIASFATKFESAAAGGGVDYITNQLIPNLGNSDTGSLTGSDATGGAPKDNASVVDETPYGTTNTTVTTYNVVWPTVIAPTNGLKLQIGANMNQNMDVNLIDASAKSLGVDSIDVVNNASTAITKFDTAIQTVSSYRSTLGAIQNRLEHAISISQISEENLTASESRIRDVDMAKEMMNQSKSGILAQAAQAMLAQANQQPQQVLQLLHG